MGNYYMDIETTGLDPRVHKIITIQYQELDRRTGKPLSDLAVLKEWESSEREILDRFLNRSGILDPYPFSFVPVGYNLNFEHNFLKERTAVHSFTPLDILDKPSIDLRPLGVMANAGEFKGSGLDMLTGKNTDGSNVPTWYAEKKFSEIEAYVKNEAESFVQFFSWFQTHAPEFLERFRKETGIASAPDSAPEKTSQSNTN